MIERESRTRPSPSTGRRCRGRPKCVLRQRLLTNPHSPGEFRVNGVLRNIDAFYTAFDVEPGDGMYLAREDRIKIW